MSTTNMQASKPGLLRQIGFFSATALVISNMVGTGTFTAGGYLAGQLGNAEYILLVWIIGAVFIVLIILELTGVIDIFKKT